MPSIDDALWTELKATIQATWPEITDAKLFKSQQMNRRNWEEDVNKGKLVAPYVIVGFAQTMPYEFAMDTEAYTQPVIIYYVCSWSDPLALRVLSDPAQGYDVTAYVRNKLSSLRTAILKYSGSGYQTLGVHPDINVSDDNPANKVFFQLQAPKFAGMLGAQLVYGQTL